VKRQAPTHHLRTFFGKNPQMDVTPGLKAGQEPFEPGNLPNSPPASPETTPYQPNETKPPLVPQIQPLFTASDPATSSFNGLHLKSKFLAVGLRKLFSFFR
jgi:hypothetical protein